MKQTNQIPGLYDPSFEHDNCGIGACVNIKGVKNHQTVDNALKIVETLEHRAGKDAAGETGDGVGIMLQISHKFFSKACKAANINIGKEREYGIGMFFFPNDELRLRQAKKMFEIIVEKEGMTFLGWREVPTTPAVLGKKALECMPKILQGFVAKPADVEKGLDFDRKLYIARKVFEQSNEESYVVSLSSRTIVYKGMFLVGQLRTFFNDLQDSDYESAIALVHSRFSTNTTPSWEKAHPYRFIVHNGEINTIRGNADKMLAREENMESEYLKNEMHKLIPVVNPNGSDSARLDNTLEFLVMSGMDLPHAIMITIPEPWENNKVISQEKRDFYQYYATMMEPWDGPASIIFTDGDQVGAVLDRNGLRPSRYYITDDDQLILSSEIGVLDIDPTKIVVKERLHPGKMLLVDTIKGKVIADDVVKEKYAEKEPYGEWLDSNLLELKDLKIPNEPVPTYGAEEREKLMKAFGYTYEDIRTAILPMALNGSEAIAAMGNDTPLAVLSNRHQPLFNYFKQLFAQVTNPPIDAIREELVTSTTVYVGKEGNILDEKPENCRVLKVHNPILTDTDLLKIKSMNKKGFEVVELPITYYKNTSLEKALDRLFVETDRAYRDGANIIILSDRGVDENHVAIPSLLAVSAMHQYLIKTKRRTSVALILESGEPREVHHFATLLGYGACAVNPYLALQGIKKLIDENMLQKDYYAAVEDYTNAILHGIVKIASKMGISTLQSYQGSQIFEAIGINSDVIEKYFTNTVSRVEGISLKDLEADVDARHGAAFDPLGLENDLTLESAGSHKYRSGKEQHLYNPQTIHTLQVATRTGSYDLFKQYTDMIDKELEPGNLRGLMEFDYPEKGIPIEEVESVDSIVKRFKTGAMSYGSISGEAHETLAIAMNKLGGKSNSGEGGERPERLKVGRDGLNRCSAIKQVASGVAKAGAQVILISGYDGGTGAAPKNSIYNAGLPWELGLAEAHQNLIMNDLRNKVIVETDGKLMSGRDVAIAAMLGAEEFGFATAPLVTLGCVMMRVCNLDTCPVGVATQNPELRKKFAGKPEYVINFMKFIAQELREYMAKLGVATVDELVGRTDLLKPNAKAAEKHVDLSRILGYKYDPAQKMDYNHKNVYDFKLEQTADMKVLMKELMPALEKKQKKSIQLDVTNIDRTFGTIFGSEITKHWGEQALEDDTYVVKCNGAGGQSFGAFIPKGLTLQLVGDSNDYFGKGLSGGKLILCPPTGIKFKAEDNIIVGNVALYGATSGKAFINGVAGERFCVRNSGATAVVEGVGDHGCEYMTGGRVLVLGPTGKNFAAGMSGGVAYVLDEDSKLYKNLNKEMVSVETVTSKYDVIELKDMLKEHVAYTNSEKGKEILKNFEQYLPKFKKIMPNDYKAMLNLIVQMEERGLSSEQAKMEAFNIKANAGK